MPENISALQPYLDALTTYLESTSFWNLIRSEPEIGIIALAIIGVSLVFALYWRHKIKRIALALDKLANLLSKSDQKGRNVLLEAIDKTDNKILKEALKASSNQVVTVSTDLGDVDYSLREHYETWQGRDLLSNKGINLPLFESMPNVLIGVGLLFTFIFLTMALNDARVILDGGEKEAVKQLLANASGKFVTSIVGLFCSIVWSYWARSIIFRIDILALKVVRQLDRIVPSIGSEAAVIAQMGMLKELISVGREQNEQLKKFDTDLAIAIGKATAAAIQPSFEMLTSKLTEALDKLSANLGSINENALNKIAEDISSSFRELSSNEMNSFKNSLLELSEKLGTATISLSESAKAAGHGFGEAVSSTASIINQSAVQLETAISNATTNLAENAKAAGYGFAEAISSTTGTINESAAQFKATINDASISFSENAKAAGDGFSEAVSVTAGKLNEGAIRLESAMAKAEAATITLGSNTQETANVISAGTSGIRSALESANLVAGNYMDVSGKLQQVADDMVAASQEVAAATSNIKTATASQNEANTLLREVLPAVGRSIEQGSAAMDAAVRLAGQSLSDIEKTLDKTSKGLETAISNINDGVSSYTDKVSDLHAQLDNAMGRAIGQLNGAITDLGEILEEKIIDKNAA